MKDFKNFKHITNRNNSDDEETVFPFGPNQQHLPYFESSQTTKMIKAYLDEDIKDAKYYRPLIHAIESAGEGDLIYLSINSYGGYLDGAIALINAMQSTEANVHACIDGTAASAASLIALAAPSIAVSPHASMMIHAATFGSFGKQSDVMSHASFVDKRVKSLMANIYKDFLTDQEFAEVLMGREMWFDFEQIHERLEKRAELMEKRLKKMKSEIKKQVSLQS
jgi:ATP-dependent protease ClpP protease subunit